MKNGKIFAKSIERYNGGIATKRMYGSSTVTVFLVGHEGTFPSAWRKIEGRGATPGDRKTNAISKFVSLEEGDKI